MTLLACCTVSSPYLPPLITPPGVLASTGGKVVGDILLMSHRLLQDANTTA